jgi:hypothetical protein
VLGQAGDHVVEVLVLDLENRDARLDLRAFLVGQRLVAQDPSLPVRRGASGIESAVTNVTPEPRKRIL